jgi:hypothetical protein
MIDAKSRRQIGWMSPLFLTAFLAGCGGGTASSNFGLGSGTGTTTTGTGTTILPSFVLTATEHTADNALVWAAPANSTGSLLTYDIYRATGVGGTLALLTSGYGSVRYTDSAIQAGTTYNYQVAARAGGLSSTSNTDSATPGGPTTIGVGDPATETAPTTSVFTAANFQGVVQASGNRLTLDVTLNHTASVSDLLSLQIGDSVYTPTSGVTVSGNHLLIDTQAAVIPVPTRTAGQLLSVTVTVANTTTSPVVANAGRLELTARVPAAGSSETDGPTGFQFTVQNTL